MEYQMVPHKHVHQGRPQGTHTVITLSMCADVLSSIESLRDPGRRTGVSSNTAGSGCRSYTCNGSFYDSVAK